MELQKLKNIIEAVLMAKGSAISVERIQLLFEEYEKPESTLIREALEELKEEFSGRGIELAEVASGFRLQVSKEVAPWVSRLWEEKPPRYTRALLETLALIAYRQPITRGDIEDVRGVSVSSQTIRTLLDRDWIRVVGHRDVPGRPAMYATTRGFLDYFNLKNLDELPTLDEIRDVDDANQKLELINAEKRASADRDYDFTSDEDVEARGEEVLAETENDLAEAEQIIDQVEENVFRKPEEEEEPSESAEAVESDGNNLTSGLDNRLEGLADRLEERLGSSETETEKGDIEVSDLIAEHQARLRGDTAPEDDSSDSQMTSSQPAEDSASGEVSDAGADESDEESERNALLQEQERLMQQLIAQEEARQAGQGNPETDDVSESEDVISESPEEESVTEYSVAEEAAVDDEDDELARMEAEAAAELELLEAEQEEQRRQEEENNKPDSLFPDN